MNWLGAPSEDKEPLPIRALRRHGVRRYTRLYSLDHVWEAAVHLNRHLTRGWYEDYVLRHAGTRWCAIEIHVVARCPIDGHVTRSEAYVRFSET